MHECDNRECININHLILGTRQQNLQDMVSKGRHNTAPGGRASRQLSDEVVSKIRNDFRSYREIAAAYSISADTVGRVKNHIGAYK